MQLAAGSKQYAVDSSRFAVSGEDSQLLGANCLPPTAYCLLFLCSIG
jgi:hypothetical protein